MDPSAVRRFAGFLTEAASDLRTRNSALSHRFVDLRATWGDHKYGEFERLFNESSATLQKFLAHSDKYAEYLRKKASIVERYLDRRY